MAEAAPSNTEQDDMAAEWAAALEQQTTGESASLGTRQGDEIVVVLVASSAQRLRFDHEHDHRKLRVVGDARDAPGLAVDLNGRQREPITGRHRVERGGHRLAAASAVVLGEERDLRAVRLLQSRTLDPLVAVHARLSWWDGGLGALLDSRMTITAVDSELSIVVLVAELHRLGTRLLDARHHLERVELVEPEEGPASDRSNDGENEPGSRIDAGFEDLGHGIRKITDRWRQRNALP